MSALTVPQGAMPKGLTFGERLIYREAWDRAAARYAKAHGLPSDLVRERGVSLAEATAAYVAAREAITHRAGMNALTRYRRARCTCGSAA